MVTSQSPGLKKIYDKLRRYFSQFLWVCAAGLSEPPTPLQSILWLIIHPIIVTLAIRAGNKLLTANFPFLSPYFPRVFFPPKFLNVLPNSGNLISWKCYPIIVNSVVKCLSNRRHIPISLLLGSTPHGVVIHVVLPLLRSIYRRNTQCMFLWQSNWSLKWTLPCKDSHD